MRLIVITKTEPEFSPFYTIQIYHYKISHLVTDDDYLYSYISVSDPVVDNGEVNLADE